jgi:Methyltransferase domain
VEYDPTQYFGAAPYYLSGRPGYSISLANVLAGELGLDGTVQLVDVGSGPGTVGMQLAALFDHVTLVEPDPGMLAEARADAASAGLRSVDFVQGTAEQLLELGLGSARTVTFVQSFHRTNRIVVAEAVYQLLEQGGSLVLISHDPTSPPPPTPAGTSPIPHEQIRTLITTFLNSQLRSGNRLVADYRVERFEQTLRPPPPVRSAAGGVHRRVARAARPPLADRAVPGLARRHRVGHRHPPLMTRPG